MSNYIQGLSDVYTITAKINALQQEQMAASTAESITGIDPQTYILEMEKDFSRMLNNLMFSGNDNDEDNNDPFSSFYENQDLFLNKSTVNNPALKNININQEILDKLQ